MDTHKKAKIIAIIIASFAFILLITIIFQFIKIGSLRKKQEELNTTLTQLEEVVADYSKQKNYYQDRETYLDEYAHELLNMSKNGEVIYSFDKN